MKTVYKINPDYSIQKISDISVVVPVSESCPKFNGMMKLTGIGPCLWEFFSNGATIDEACHYVTDKYNVSFEEAQKDISEFVTLLLENNLILKVY